MPTKEIIATPGIRYFAGMVNRRINSPTIGMFMASNITLPINSAATRPQTTSGFLVNNRGPGVMSKVKSIANNTAVVPEPGTPNASMGTNAPPAAALFPASGAATPRGSPLPNVSSLLETFFSRE